MRYLYEEVLQLVKEKRSMVKTIKRSQINWTGQTLRGNSIPRTVLVGRTDEDM